MTKKNLIKTLAAVLTLSLFTGVMAGCGSRSADGNMNPAQGTLQVQEQAEGGVISVRVNPEIAVTYDEQGLVTMVEGRNDDGKTIAADFTEYEGKECRQVICDLVAKIDGAGYLVEETEGKGRQITLEIEAGSILPSENFLSNIVAGIQEYTGSKNLNTSVAVDGESNYGWTNYGDTDYGPDNDGVTDYNDTDYGPNNDGVTDYDDTDYGPNNDGVTDYDDTDYGPNNDGVTDYDDTDYGPDNDGVTDYDDTDYGPYNDGVTDYSTPAPAAPAPAAPAAPAYSGGSTDYDDGDTDYDDGSTDYDDGGTDSDD